MNNFTRHLARNRNKALAFIKRDFIVESSYKLAFILQLVNSFFPVLSFFFIGNLINEDTVPGLGKYGSSYFSFALIGVAFTRYFQLAMDTFSENMKRAQMAGCLEAIIGTQSDPKTIVIMSSFYSFLSAGVQMIFMFLVGTFMLGFSWSSINVPGALAAFAVSLIAFISLGIFCAAGTVVFKRGEPFGWLFGVLSGLLGGALFPVDVMPTWLQWLSHIFPTTYALDALRLTILKGYSISMISNQLMIIGGMTLVLFPLSLKTFQWAIEKGKRDGTLIQY